MGDFELTTAEIRATLDGMERIPVSADGTPAAVTVDQLHGYLIDQAAPLPRDGSLAMEGPLAMADHRIVGLADGVDGTDAATTGQVEQALTVALGGGLVGFVLWFAAATPPAGFLVCDGAKVDQATHAALFGVIGATFVPTWMSGETLAEGDLRKSPRDGQIHRAQAAGVTSGTDVENDGGVPWVPATEFLLPDLRGEFIRGWDRGRGVDPDRAFGVAQMDVVGPHEHGTNGNQITTVSGGASVGSGGGKYWNGAYPVHTMGALEGIGSETRPRNVALLPCIKY
jgi:microcystin-dependent protein